MSDHPYQAEYQAAFKTFGAADIMMATYLNAWIPHPTFVLFLLFVLFPVPGIQPVGQS